MKDVFPNLDKVLKSALDEDIGTGDITSESVIPPGKNGLLVLVAKAKGVICGLPVFARIHTLIDKDTAITLFKNDGDVVMPGDEIALIKGNLRSLLAAERVSLNFLQRLSGIASLTRKFVEKVRPYGLKIYDTRKTTPLLRQLEKYAVRCGGGHNHRFGLYDMILLKDNHIDACGGIEQAIIKAQSYRRKTKSRVKIAVEVRSLSDMVAVLPFEVDLVLLDNMTYKQIRNVLRMVDDHKKPEIEVSGGITLKTISRLAEIGVRRVSIGALTHSAPALDLSLDYRIL